VDDATRFVAVQRLGRRESEIDAVETVSDNVAEHEEVVWAVVGIDVFG